MAPERTLPPASVRGALLSQVTLMDCPLCLMLLWHGNGRQRRLWGEERDLCATHCSHPLFLCCQKPRIFQCAAHRTILQSLWDKRYLLQSAPVCWRCLPDVLIPLRKIGKSFTPSMCASLDTKVGMSRVRVNHCVHVIAALVKKNPKQTYRIYEMQFTEKCMSLAAVFPVINEFFEAWERVTGAYLDFCYREVW